MSPTRLRSDLNPAAPAAPADCAAVFAGRRRSRTQPGPAGIVSNLQTCRAEHERGCRAGSTRSLTIEGVSQHEIDRWSSEEPESSDAESFSTAQVFKLFVLTCNDNMQISNLDELIQDMLEAKLQKQEHAQGDQLTEEAQSEWEEQSAEHAERLQEESREREEEGVDEGDSSKSPQSLRDGLITTEVAMEQMLQSAESDDAAGEMPQEQDPVQQLLQRLQEDTKLAAGEKLSEIKVMHTKREDIASAHRLFDERRACEQSSSRRVTNGFASVLLYDQVLKSSDADSAKNARVDCDVLTRSLSQLGFARVDFKSNLTREDTLTLLRELSTALQANNNLGDADAFLLYIQSVGSPGSFLCSPSNRRPVVEDFQQFVHIAEVVRLLSRTIPNRPKIIMLNLCSQGRRGGEDRMFAAPSACNHDYHQDVLNAGSELTFIMSITRGKNHWITNSGSIFQQRFVANLKKGRGGIFFDEIFQQSLKELRDLFIERQGSGKPECEVGKAAYESFFLQKPLMIQQENSFRVLFGPSLRFSEQRTSKDLYIKGFGTVACKKTFTENFAFIASEDIFYIASIKIDRIEAYAWEFHLMQVEENLQVHFGATHASNVQACLAAYGPKANEEQEVLKEASEQEVGAENQEGHVNIGATSWMLDMSRNSLRTQAGARVQVVKVPSTCLLLTCCNKVWYDRINGTLLFTMHNRLVQKVLHCFNHNHPGLPILTLHFLLPSILFSLRVSPSFSLIVHAAELSEE
eukprot:750102-Hanusia_phi.AAC.1